ncbi:MAG: BMP family ABC transporter substrate-binding protein [Spirochaetaceae bacterium]|nr:BMP family ABC transporter substrate-binding protein [Spirochaetaceae bacterium]
MKKTILFILCFFMIASLAVFAGGNQESAEPAPEVSEEPVGEVSMAPTKPVRLGVFVPGRLGDSPPYDGMAEAAEKLALREDMLELMNIFEAGFDQSKWPEMLLAFAASGKYDVIYTSNESMSPLIVEIMDIVPNVKFIVNDSYVRGNDRLFTTFFNKWQQSYFYGYMMALISLSDMENINTDKKIGLVFGQHYVMMDDLIIPGIEAGARAVDPEFELITAMLGNWYDAAKAEQLALSMVQQGVDVFGTIAGSGNAGVLSAAVNKGVYVVWYDNLGFDKAPGTVVASIEADNGGGTENNLKRLIEGTLPWGEPEVLGMEHGYIYVPLRAGAYVRSVPEDVRAAFEQQYNKVVDGEIKLPVPQAVLDKIDAASK